jgi:hypothetical protein
MGAEIPIERTAADELIFPDTECLRPRGTGDGAPLECPRRLPPGTAADPVLVRSGVAQPRSWIQPLLSGGGSAAPSAPRTASRPADSRSRRRPTDRHQTDGVSRPDRRNTVLVVPFPASRLVRNSAWRHLDLRICASGRGRTAWSRLSEGDFLAASLTRTRQRIRRARRETKQGRTHRPGEQAQQRRPTQRRRQTSPRGLVPQTRLRRQPPPARGRTQRPAHTLAGPRLARANSPRSRTVFRID